MAIVEFTCLINRIIGKINSSVFSTYRGTSYIRSLPSSFHSPNTTRQQHIKSNITSLSKLWYDLPNDIKDLWNSYATKRKLVSSGYNHFVSHNANILNSCHSDLIYRSGPPPTPSTPTYAKGFCIFAMSHTQICLSWTKPSSSILFVTAGFKLHRGFCNRYPSHGCCVADGYHPSLRYINTTKSNLNSTVYDHSWPSATRLFFRLFTIDKYGRKSPPTHSLHFLNVAFPAAYGFTYFGLSYYFS